MRNLALVQVVAEQWHAFRISRRMLRDFRITRRIQRTQSGAALYEQVVARLTGLNVDPPAIVVKHAKESFAAWPVKRALRLRDVVHYVAYSSYVNSHASSHGTRSDMRGIVELVIRETL